MKDVLMSSQGGVLLVDKEEGVTSHGVVSFVRRILGGRRASKVGHAGTLDPFATGLLVVMVGESTKLSRYLSAVDKTYRAVMKLGEATDTMDRTGRTVKSTGGPLPDASEISAVSKRFIGTIEQVPPMYSAVKHGGVRAYSLARKGFEVQLKKRRVNVSRLELVEYDPPFATLEIHCSSGTYVRSLAADLGEALGSAAHLTGLRRLSVGAFGLADAVASSRLREQGFSCDDIRRRLTAPGDALHGMVSVNVSRQTAERIRAGHPPSMAEIREGSASVPPGEGLVKVLAERELVAVGRLSSAESTAGFSVERVFLSCDRG